MARRPVSVPFVRMPATRFRTCPRTRVKEPPTIFPEFPAKVVLGFAVLEIDASHLTVTFFDHTGKQIGGPYTTVKK